MAKYDEQTYQEACSDLRGAADRLLEMDGVDPVDVLEMVQEVVDEHKEA